MARSKNAAKISVPLQGPKSAAAQMLKFTTPTPCSQHTPQTPGRRGRKEATSRLRLSQGLHCTLGMPTPAAGTSRLPTVWEYSSSRFLVSLITPGNLSSPLPALCRCGPAGIEGRETLLASPSNLTRNTPRGRSKLRQPAEPGAAVRTFWDQVRGAPSAR